MPCLWDVPNLSREKCLRVLAFLRLRDFFAKSSSHSGRSCKRFPAAPFLLREFAGFNEFDESCGGDVEDELVLEHDESPRTTRETKFSVLHRMFFPSLVRCGSFDHWSTHKCIRALRKACLMTGRQACLRATAQSRGDGDRERTLVLWVCSSSLAVNTFHCVHLS